MMRGARALGTGNATAACGPKVPSPLQNHNRSDVEPLCLGIRHTRLDLILKRSAALLPASLLVGVQLAGAVDGLDPFLAERDFRSQIGQLCPSTRIPHHVGALISV